MTRMRTVCMAVAAVIIGGAPAAAAITAAATITIRILITPS